MKTFVELFTSPTCPFCPAAKAVTAEVVDALAANGEEISLASFDVSTSGGSTRAAEYGITSVPNIVVYAGAGRKILIEGAPKRASLEKAIQIARGKAAVPEKKSFFSKLRSTLRGL